MAAEPRPADAADPPVDRRPGAVLALLLLCVYGGFALSVDFPRAAMGIHSDEATYYMMGHSLAEDGDLTYHRRDLERVWKEFPSGPAGVFLKKGRDVVDGGLMLKPPFFWLESRAGPGSGAPLLRQVVHLPAVRGAVRGARGHQRLPAAARRAARGGRVVRLPVPARAGPGRAVGAAHGRVPAGDGGAGLLRVDRAGAVQLRARRPGVFLLAVQGSRGARPHAPGPPVDGGRRRRSRRRGPAGPGDVLETVERAPLRADRRAAACGAGGRCA